MLSSSFHLIFHLTQVLSINNNFTRLKDWSFNKQEVRVTIIIKFNFGNYLLDKLSEEPDEWFLKLIVALCRDIIVLKILLSMEGDLLGFDLSVLNIDLVAHQDNRDVLTDSDQVLVPLGHILVGNSAAHIEHNNSRMPSNAIQ